MSTLTIPKISASGSFPVRRIIVDGHDERVVLRFIINAQVEREVDVFLTPAHARRLVGDLAAVVGE